MACHGKEQTGCRAGVVLVVEPHRLADAAAVCGFLRQTSCDHFRLRVHMDSVYPQPGHPSPAQGRAHGLRGLRQKNSASVELLSELRREGAVKLLLGRGDGLRGYSVFPQDLLLERRVLLAVGGELLDETVNVCAVFINRLDDLRRLRDVVARVTGLQGKIARERGADDDEREQQGAILAAQRGDLLRNVGGRLRGGLKIVHGFIWRRVWPGPAAAALSVPGWDCFC